jgi:hypothetical protein
MRVIQAAQTAKERSVYLRYRAFTPVIGIWKRIVAPNNRGVAYGVGAEDTV